nr:hypothetical protein [Tanacetum cinerariifolium]
VAAARNTVEQHRIEALHRGRQVALEHAVQLKRLARGQLEGAVAVAVAQLAHARPLRGRAHAARHSHPHHEGVERLQLLALALTIEVT